MKARIPTAKELKRINDYPFVEKTCVRKYLDYTRLYVKLKPIVISIRTFRSERWGKYRGIRHIYIGNQTLNISIGQSGKATYVKGEIRHPQVNGYHRPCFGTVRDKIQGLINKNEYALAIQLIWFWAHDINLKDCYVKPWELYDNALSMGFPVYDGRNTLIKINDPKRIKNKEQRRLKKLKAYNSNIKKLKDFKIR